ncbi:hypothetical protein BJ138DRAFT_1154743 [Hygrophoropsis aurantiaca]|uniref:Uncharacterized protein n=1 Tax=Hygrophoropsis aurantiaca TaxID=72124 RepID=A0ACB8A8Y9_9AGAM|nr:hypothetical protein BJ138DRAFT_1154743 [Hygrophoropsis aurantiaca]
MSSTTRTVPPRITIDKQDLLCAQQAGHSKMRVYQCKWRTPNSSNCLLWIADNNFSFIEHLKNYHGVPSDNTRRYCQWDGCGEIMAGFELAYHIPGGGHIGMGVFCSGCQKFMSRINFMFHAATNEASSCPGATAIPGSYSHSRIVDVQQSLGHD